MSVIYKNITPDIVRILIDNPNKRNAINYQILTSFLDAIGRFEADDKTKVAIIGGVEGNFCAGYDLNEIIQKDTGLLDKENIQRLLLPIDHRLSHKKLTIAAIEGHAAGFGFELALRCDFRVGDAQSRMGFMNRRFGIPIMNGGSVLLPELIGRSNAIDLIATGKAELAHDARTKGLLNYIGDVGCSLGRSYSLARCLAKFEQEPLILDLKGIHSGSEHPRDSRLIDLMKLERQRALEFIDRCQPREQGLRFLKGEICRHGNFDLGNTMSTEADVSL